MSHPAEFRTVDDLALRAGVVLGPWRLFISLIHLPPADYSKGLFCLYLERFVSDLSSFAPLRYSPGVQAHQECKPFIAGHFISAEHLLK